MVGVTDCWRKVGLAINRTPAQSMSDLRHIVDRRNQIVHEADLIRMVRRQTIRRNAVNPDEIEDHIDWLDDFVDALDSIL